MSTELSDEEVYSLSKTAEKRGFWAHFVLYVIVNLLLLVIWRLTGGGLPWFLFPLGIWGLLIVLHFVRAVVLTGRSRRLSDHVKRRMETMKPEETPSEVGMTGQSEYEENAGDGQ